MTTYMNIDAGNRRRRDRQHLVRAAAAQRTPLNTECKRLLLGHAFETLDCIAVEFRTHRLNRRAGAPSSAWARSSTASCARTALAADGTLRDTAVYSITAAEWPAVQVAPRLAARQAALNARIPGASMAGKKKTLGIDDLWKIERLGAPSLAPDGAQAVATVTRFSMEDNKSQSALWLLSTLGGAPRQLTHCGEKDGQPRWSPRGDRIAFTAKREQQGKKDERGRSST